MVGLKSADYSPIPAPVTGALTQPKSRPWQKYLAFVATALLLVYAVGPPHRPGSRPPRLTPKEAENLFLTLPNAEHALEVSRRLATHPHVAGYPEDFQDAKDILKFFQEELGAHSHHEPIFKAGSHRSRHAIFSLTGPSILPRHPTAWVDTYFPVLNKPINSSLEQIDENGKVIHTANLWEEGDPLDPEAWKYRDAIPAFHGFSFSGEATGEFVYANYGRQEDYADLLAKGVDFSGKIVIVRYGGIFRGLKIYGAQQLGAAGVLIYSDPRDDGYVTEENGYLPYPRGPAHNPSAVQRGSAQYLSMYPGDPTTPGYPAYEDAERQEGVNIPKIPSLPISWKTVQAFLPEIRDGKETGLYPSLNGKVSKTRLKLVNNMDTKVTPIWNTMAAIPGHIRDEVVLIGCHRDAWVMGAADPTSGTVSLLEIVRGLGTLLKKGWRPLRTILIASWDGEEYGLVGSTEFGEDFPRWIEKHVVSYLNVDVSVSGSRWNVAASPSLVDLIQRSAEDVPHPTQPNRTLWDARLDAGPFFGNLTGGKEPALHTEGAFLTEAPESDIKPLGSGSDYTVFLQRLGIASADQGFGFTSSDAVYHYHSIYDSQHWQEVYGDPTFERHVAVAKHLGLLALRLADSIILPLNTTRYSHELDKYLDHVEKLANDNLEQFESLDFEGLRESIKALQRSSEKLDWEKTKAEKKLRKLFKKLPRHEPAPPPDNASSFPHACKIKSFCHIRDAISTFQASLYSIFAPTQPLENLRADVLTHHEILASVANWEHKDATHPPPRHFPVKKLIKAVRRVQRANQKLRSFERGFISEDGIKDREWYRHLGVAPGKWLGYGATTLPALTEAITIERNTTQAVYEVERLIHLIDDLAEKLAP